MILTPRIGDLVKRPPVAVRPDTSVREAVSIMHRENIGSVVVTDFEGRVLGIFTEKDLVRIIAEGISLETKIAEVMTRNPVVIREDEPVSKAVTIMAEKRIRHLPVVGPAGILKGVVSARDIALTFKRYLEELGEVGD